MPKFWFEDSVTRGAARRARNESSYSYLPGREDGPADAYRHVVLAAELTRKVGAANAWLILEANEKFGIMGSESTAMDRHNNAIGVVLGQQIINNIPNNKWEDVLSYARDMFDSSDGSGSPLNHGNRYPNTLIWFQDSATWKKNPKGIDNKELDIGDPRINWGLNRQPWPAGPYIPDGENDDYYSNYDDYDSYSTGTDYNKLFNQAQDVVPYRDPLALDLDGDGIETAGLDAGVLFDHDNDGIKTTTGWIKGDDGLLVFDRNGDGLINNGGELFGDNTQKYDGSGLASGAPDAT